MRDNTLNILIGGEAGQGPLVGRDVDRVMLKKIMEGYR